MATIQCNQQISKMRGFMLRFQAFLSRQQKRQSFEVLGTQEYPHEPPKSSIS